VLDGIGNRGGAAMIAIELAAAGLLMTGGVASGSQPPDGAPPEDQAAAQAEAPAADDRSADQPGADAGQATSEAETDSIRGDRTAVAEPAWLIGRWCQQGQYYFTVREGHELAFDGQTYPVLLLRLENGTVSLGPRLPPESPAEHFIRGLAIAMFHPAEGERSFRTFASGWSENSARPLVRC
jgi:hypothetical protein